MNKKEIDLLTNICNKHNVYVDLFKDLIEIEKEYISLNLARRQGIFGKIESTIEKYIDKEVI